jgi:hypothetical protein
VDLAAGREGSLAVRVRLELRQMAKLLLLTAKAVLREVEVNNEAAIGLRRSH